MSIGKTIIVSAAVSANMIIWHEVFGVKFLVIVGIGIMGLILISRTK